MCPWNTKRRKKAQSRRNVSSNNCPELSNINDRHQTTDAKVQRTPSTINTNKTTPGHILFKPRIPKTKRKSWKNPEENYFLPIEKQG